jgi:hypothetical protein
VATETGIYSYDQAEALAYEGNVVEVPDTTNVVDHGIHFDKSDGIRLGVRRTCSGPVKPQQVRIWQFREIQQKLFLSQQQW